MKRAAALGGMIALILACSSTTSTPGSPLPCAIENVLGAHCRTCHGATPSFGAPMSLVSYEDLHAKAKSAPSRSVYELVGERIHDEAHPMPQPPNHRLSALETATLDNWVAAGAPAPLKSEVCKSPSYDGGAIPGLSCKPDVSVRPISPWAMPQEQSDVYVCYGVDIPALPNQQAIAFAPHIDNTKIVHHVLLYEAQSSRPITPGLCPLGVGQAKLVYGWAPGGGPFELPPEAGYKMAGADGVAHYVVQVHYNNLAGLAEEEDTSGFDLCTTTTPRPNDADVIAFGSMSFTIPAHGALDITCDYPIPKSVTDMHVISAFPHMHQLGTTIATTASGQSGNLDLGAVNNWSFTNQLWSPMSATVHGGDVIHTRCAWNNPTSADVSFGEFTQDEMCYSFTMYWPATDAFHLWALPAARSTCVPTPH